MRLIPTQICTSGMKLAKNIYNDSGVVLLRMGSELSDAIINKLQTYGIEYIYIQDPFTDDIVVPELIRSETRVRVLGEMKVHFRKISDGLHRKRYSDVSIEKNLRKIIHSLLDDLRDNDQALIMMDSMRVSDEYLYSHSLNVAIYAVLLGVSVGYTEDKLIEFGIGSLMHDIGKTQIDEKLLQKPGKLTETEFAEVKKHTTLGYEVLKEMSSISLPAAHCAYQHHERMNGSGYPRGLTGDEIHEYAKWLGIIDSFDAMVSHRVYRKALLPHHALEVLYAGSGTLYDESKIQIFRNKVVVYPIGMSVMLSTKETGVVADVNVDYPHRPVVRVMTKESGESWKEPYEIDLSKKLNVTITDILFSEHCKLHIL
ncbi:HD-GYP domain-containing protein [Longirhabdus pacifica]|uniref:HD-GYP domain-containing protein n=1 Tax=Longirhabdus pacifica TaxID=2305227 RepID=UPI001008E551|nr:HD-GYP domain-containing protein [Longirhabdus pacifica]